jgi:hypothetical protein
MNTPEFAIFQNSRTKQSGVWNGERWVFPPKRDFELLRVLATLIRIDPNPVGIVKSIQLNKKKPNNWDVEPGFFIPPEELDGLE